jgi:F-type H+-transporting ATPase subunit a
MKGGITILPETLFSVGPVHITDTIITTWIVMAVISVISFLATRRLSIKPSVFQEITEAVFESVEKTVMEVLPVEPWAAVPVLGTIWILIGFSNLIGLLPGLSTPTADLNTTFAFAVLSYSMTHVFGIKTRGIRGYLSHYKEPSWLLLPMHLMAEVTRTIALAVRLFGNMLSGEMIAAILIGVVGFLAPIPFDLLHIVIGIIQAYIFGILTLVFIAIGISPEG